MRQYAVKDMFTPPAAWTDLPDVVPEPSRLIQDPSAYTTSISSAQKPLYDALPEGVYYTREELEKEGIPITLAGKRSSQDGGPAIGYPQQEAEDRQMFEEFHESRQPKKEEVSLRASPDETLSILALKGVTP